MAASLLGFLFHVIAHVLAVYADVGWLVYDTKRSSGSCLENLQDMPCLGTVYARRRWRRRDVINYSHFPMDLITFLVTH